MPAEWADHCVFRVLAVAAALPGAGAPQGRAPVDERWVTLLAGRPCSAWRARRCGNEGRVARPGHQPPLSRILFIAPPGSATALPKPL